MQFSLVLEAAERTITHHFTATIRNKTRLSSFTTLSFIRGSTRHKLSRSFTGSISLCLLSIVKQLPHANLFLSVGRSYDLQTNMMSLCVGIQTVESFNLCVRPKVMVFLLCRWLLKSMVEITILFNLFKLFNVFFIVNTLSIRLRV